ncbi:MAG: universal stress protein [Deltaproteobacteria bacterium]|nr:universal stress protein [Deltaproteobacteria bacterium]
MASLKKIAFCTDFSENSEQAFDLAFDLTLKYQAQLYLVHVVPPLVFPSPVMEDFISEQANLQFYKDAVQRAMEQIETVYLQKMGDYQNAFIRVLSGHPASEILNFVDQEKIDLIVMGTHGLTGLAHFFLGSTAEKVVRRANCSVLTVHPPKK